MVSCKALESIRLPIKQVDLENGEETFTLQDWPILDPHTILCFLIENAGLRIPRERVEEYWRFNAHVGEPWAQHGEWDRLPVGFYGDSARVSSTFGSQNVLGLFVNLILWTPSSVRSSRFLVFAIQEELLWKHYTLDTALRRVTWSLNSLVDGKHPALGPYGDPLSRRLQLCANKAMQFRCQITEVRGDWSWHKKLFRFYLTRWTGIKICHHCDALSKSNDNRQLYWSFDDHSWSGGCFSLEEFFEKKVPPRYICVLVCIKSSAATV